MTSVVACQPVMQLCPLLHAGAATPIHLAEQEHQPRCLSALQHRGTRYALHLTSSAWHSRPLPACAGLSATACCTETSGGAGDVCMLTCLLAAGWHYLPNFKDVAAEVPLPNFIFAGEVKMIFSSAALQLPILLQHLAAHALPVNLSSPSAPRHVAAEPVTADLTSVLLASRIASCKALSSPLHLGCRVATRWDDQLTPEGPLPLGHQVPDRGPREQPDAAHQAQLHQLHRGR